VTYGLERLHNYKMMHTNKQDCTSVLEEYTLKLKILSVFPVNDRSEFNKEVVGAILDILQGVLEVLMTASTTEEEDTAAQSNSQKMEKKI
jgi:hypothetical protein